MKTPGSLSVLEPGDNWQKMVGKRQYFQAFAVKFRAEAITRMDAGQAELRRRCEGMSAGDANRLKRSMPPAYGWVIHHYLPALMSGVASSYFHGIVQLAFSLLNAENSYGNTDLLGDALAFLAYS